MRPVDRAVQEVMDTINSPWRKEGAVEHELRMMYFLAYERGVRDGVNESNERHDRFRENLVANVIAAAKGEISTQETKALEQELDR